MTREALIAATLANLPKFKARDIFWLCSCTEGKKDEKKSKKEKSKMTVWGKKDKDKSERDTKSKDKKK